MGTVLRAAQVDPPIQTVSVPKSRSVAGPIAIVLSLAVSTAALLSFFGPAIARASLRPLQLQTADQWSALFLAFVSSVILHEAGHLFASMALRFEVTSVSLGPLRFSRSDGRWAIQLSFKQAFQASVGAVPRSQRAWRNRMLLVVAAGPIATVLTLAVACLAVKCLGADTGCEFFRALAQFNFVLFFLTLIPTPSNAARPSDARLLISLWRFDHQARSILLFHLLTTFRMQGRRPRQYPEWIIRRSAAVDAWPQLRVFFAQTIADWALDRGELAAAEAWNRHLGALVAGMAPPTPAILAHAACLDLLLQNDAAAASAKLSAISIPSLRPRWLRHRTEAIRALISGDVAIAVGELCRSEFYRPGGELPYFAYEHMLVKRIRQLLGECVLNAAM